MKTFHNVKGHLDASNWLKRYSGTKVREDGTVRPYDLASTKVTVYLKDGAYADPNGSHEGCVAERYSVCFSKQMWDAIAGVASVVDLVTLEGTLIIPERGDAGFYEGRRADGSTYLGGDLTNARPVAHTPSVFKGALLPKFDELKPEEPKDTRAQATVEAANLS